MSFSRLYTRGWEEYELIDAGGGKKLERWGSVITIRPEVQAYFKSEKTFQEWTDIANWEFIYDGKKIGNWKCLKPGSPSEWTINYQKLTFSLKLTKYKHVGLFPEQKINWDYIFKKLNKTDAFLNLFAYTGASSLFAKNICDTVYHVDSVRNILGWAKRNMTINGFSSIRWVHDDALKFISREVNRGKKYDGIIMDPPAWGIGPKKERWKLEDELEQLIFKVSRVIKSDGFLVVNTYSPKIDCLKLKVFAEKYFYKSRIEVFELWMKASTGKDLFYGNLLRVQGLN